MAFTLEQAKKAFFDRRAVKKAIDSGARKGLSKFGGKVRIRARHSIRKRKGPSDPGKPPHSHTHVLRNYILYAYQGETKSVVIGPTLTNQRNAFGTKGKTIPQTLEEGGLVGIHEHQLENRPSFGPYAGQWIRTDLRFRIYDGSMRSAVGRKRRIRWAFIRPRPYMQPAFDVEKKKFPQILKDLIR